MARNKVLERFHRFRWKINNTRLMGIVRGCSEALRREALLTFDGGDPEAKWAARHLDMPDGFPGFENSTLEFKNSEIQECLNPTVADIEGLLKGAISGGLAETAHVEVSSNGPGSKTTIPGRYGT